MVAQWNAINNNYKDLDGYKRVAWPPASDERVVREFTPQPQAQYQMEPSYNQQQPCQPSAVPSAQGQIYNNIQQNPHQKHQPPPQYYNNLTSANNHARESISPYSQRMPNENLSSESSIGTFPPQTPEKPIVLVDKQFSRQPSQEPTQQWHQQEHPQNQSPTIYQESPIYQQQYRHPSHQSRQHEPLQQHQPHYPPRQQETSGGWSPQPKQEYSHITGSNDPYTSLAQTHHQEKQQQHPYYYNKPQEQQYQPHQQQSQQYSPQPQYQTQVPSHTQYQQHPQYQQPQLEKQFQQPHWVQQQHLPQPYKVPTQQSHNQVPQQYQAPSYQPQQYQQKHPEYSLSNHQVPHQQYQAPSQNQFVSQPNQQFNSYSQPQRPQTVSHDQTDKLIQEHHHDQRGGSPGIITLRKEAPVSQAPAPVYTSQPAAVSFQGGSNLRGDLKWPPPECKEAMARENEERRQLALGPVCRPRKVKRDYTPFFAKNALSHHYPSYKVPPGTQHM